MFLPGLDAPRGSAGTLSPAQRMVDPYGRMVSYVRLSVTDRCDCRCVYCMPERMSFLPKGDVLSLEELDRLGSAFVKLGARKIRLTGGEPLVRRDVMVLIRSLSRHLASGALDELTLTTNGSQLASLAGDLAACAVKRINVSLDTLDAAKFRAISRRGDLSKVLAGLDAGDRAGLKIKINTVALKGVNEAEAPALVAWAHARGYDLTFIEVMPLGGAQRERLNQHVPLTQIRASLAERFKLTPSMYRSSGPARYCTVEETGGRVGFITPLTHSFCEACNRVRVTCAGKLYLCLGHEEGVDLRGPLRSSASDETLVGAIQAGISQKPKGHDFVAARLGGMSSTTRAMSVTGG